MIETLSVQTRSRIEMIDMTLRIQKVVDQSGIQEGLCVVFVPHTTAALTINENADADVQRDIIQHLSSLIPHKSSYRHAEGNSDSHIKVSLSGSSETILITQGRLLLGTWQSVFLCEFDGARNRKCCVKVIAG